MSAPNESKAALILIALICGVAMYAARERYCIQAVKTIFTAEKTVAHLNDEFTEWRREGGLVQTGSSYNVSYKFVVNGKTYYGDSATGDVPQTDMEVWYLPESPTINGLELKGHAWIDLFIFGVPFSVFAICAIKLVRSILKSLKTENAT